jgi:hypothetical protein
VFALFLFVLLGILFAVYRLKYFKPEILKQEITEFNPATAWLRAGMFFCFFFIVSWGTGTMETVLNFPVATSQQLSDPSWRLWVISLTVLILVAYWGIWARYTIRFDRKLDLLPQITFGLLWGVSFGQMLISIWRIVVMLTPNWAPWQQGILAYVFISLWQWLLMDMYWDIYISPEHDSPKSIKLKVPLTHVPNVTLSLIFFILYQNYAIFIALQTLALLGASIHMRMPAPWSTDKTPAARREPSIFWGLPRCGGYISEDPENDLYLKAAHLA